MVNKLITHLARHLFFQRFKFRVIELKNFACFHIDEMFVMLPRLFIAGAAITEFQSLNNPSFLKQLYCSVDCGNRNRVVLLNRAAIQLINIWMILGVTNHIDYDLPLAGHSNAFLQAFFKEVVSHLKSPCRGGSQIH